MIRLTTVAATILFCSGAMSADLPSGQYRLDKSHASLIFRVDHLGFSNYTARFTRFDAVLEFDAEDLSKSSVAATVDATSLETDFPNPEVVDFNAMLQNEQWLDAGVYPEMTWRSTDIEMTGENTGKITGDLTLRGSTRPVTLDVTFNGGYRGHEMDPNARIGFSARGAFDRSAFGMVYGIPEPGSSMGVSDRVEVILEAEFSGPPFSP